MLRNAGEAGTEPCGGLLLAYPAPPRSWVLSPPGSHNSPGRREPSGKQFPSPGMPPKHGAGWYICGVVLFSLTKKEVAKTRYAASPASSSFLEK